MPFFEVPTSLRLRDALSGSLANSFSAMSNSTHITQHMLHLPTGGDLSILKAHSSHPDFAHLILLVFEAVLEVVCVSLPGYIVARQGMFDANAQKFVANLNVQLFTPCLVFTKLASQLNADKLLDLAVIPVIFCVQTFVSWACATLVSKLLRFPKRQTNFVIAMGVFGNSNSLPISLVISLSKTLKGLHWDQIPGDNDDEVAARGILYLLIFQQLGQLVRWSWGYNVLLKPAEEYERSTAGSDSGSIEEGRYRDEVVDGEADPDKHKRPENSDYGSGSSGAQSPHTISTVGSSDSLITAMRPNDKIVTPANGNVVHRGEGNLAGRGLERHPSLGHITQFPSYNGLSNRTSPESQDCNISYWQKIKNSLAWAWARFTAAISTFFTKLFRSLPLLIRRPLGACASYTFRIVNAIYQSMNPPLWAMLAAVIVASVPSLQHLFFDKGTFLNNSVTHAVAQSGGVAVPLILVVLGANLARNTLPQEELAISSEEKSEERKLLYAALVARMLLPTLFIAPFLAIFARYVPVSILDDPIFVIVCFLLTGAPSALQLAQICQLNNVFMGVMSKLLFQSYVIWILPSTLILVMLALETVEWTTAPM